jgi:hypothetical protein
MSEQGIDEYARITVMVNLPIEYSDKPVTPFGGMALMKRFIVLFEDLPDYRFSLLCDQPRPASGSNLEHLQQPSGLREQNQGTEAGLRFDAFCLQDFWAT